MVLRIVNDWEFEAHKTWRSNSDFLTGVNSEIEAVVSQKKPMKWNETFMIELKRAASGFEDTKSESRAAIAFSAWTQKLATTKEKFEDDESKTNSLWLQIFINELRETAELDNSHEDRQYDDRSFCFTIDKSQVDYPTAMRKIEDGKKHADCMALEVKMKDEKGRSCSIAFSQLYDWTPL